MNGHHVMQDELNAWLPTTEFTKRVHDQAVPRYRRSNADSKSASLAEGDPAGTSLRILDILQDASRVTQEHLSRIAQSHPTGEPVEQEESHILFEIPDLSRQRRLRDTQSCSGSPEMLLFSHADEIAQMPEFH